MKICNFLIWMTVFALVLSANYAKAGIIEMEGNFNDKVFLLKRLVPAKSACIFTRDTHYSIRLFDTKLGWATEHPYFSLEWTVFRGTKAIQPTSPIQFVIPKEAADTKRWEISFLKFTGNEGESIMEEMLTITPFRIRYEDRFIKCNPDSSQYIDLQMIE